MRRKDKDLHASINIYLSLPFMSVASSAPNNLFSVNNSISGFSHSFEPVNLLSRISGMLSASCLCYHGGGGGGGNLPLMGVPVHDD